MTLYTPKLGGWGLVLGWDAIMLGLPGRYVGAGVRWPWDVRHPLPAGCTKTEVTIGWVWVVWGRRRATSRPHPEVSRVRR